MSYHADFEVIATDSDSEVAAVEIPIFEETPAGYRRSNGYAVPPLPTLAEYDHDSTEDAN